MRLTAQQCAAYVATAEGMSGEEAAVFGRTPRLYDESTKRWRDLTPGEIARGRRFIARAPQRAAHHLREEQTWERTALADQRRERSGTDTMRLRSASEGIARIAASTR
jgi:hypothetical protein